MAIRPYGLRPELKFLSGINGCFPPLTLLMRCFGLRMEPKQMDGTSSCFCSACLLLRVPLFRLLMHRESDADPLRFSLCSISFSISLTSFLMSMRLWDLRVGDTNGSFSFEIEIVRRLFEI